MSGLIVAFGFSSIEFTCTVQRAAGAEETVVGSSYQERFGGKAANQAVAAYKLGGVSAALIGKVGDDDYGRQYYAMLKSMGINTDGLVVGKSLTTGVVHITAAENEIGNRIIEIPGANRVIKGEDFLVGKSKDLLEKAEVGLFQCDVDQNVNFLAMKKMKEDGAGLTILNCAPAKGFDDKLLKYADIVVLNESQIHDILGVEMIDMLDTEWALQQLIQFGVDIVILTLGSRGAAYSSSFNERVNYASAKNSPECVVDTTGAADAFCGALAYAFVKLRGRPLAQKIGFACEAATHSVTSPGTQDSYPTGIDVYQFIKNASDLRDHANNF